MMIFALLFGMLVLVCRIILWVVLLPLKILSCLFFPWHCHRIVCFNPFHDHYCHW